MLPVVCDKLATSTASATLPARIIGRAPTRSIVRPMNG
jgi:hypothetical protein